MSTPSTPKTLAIVGGGPKALAIATKAYALKLIGFHVPRIIIFEPCEEKVIARIIFIPIHFKAIGISSPKPIGGILSLELIIVVAAGRWSPSLLKPLGIILPTFERTIQINRFCKNHFNGKIPLFIDSNLQAFGHFFADGSFAGGALSVQGKNDFMGGEQRLSLSDAHLAKLHISKRLNWLKNASLEGGIRATESYTEDSQGVMQIIGYDNLLVSTGFSCTGFTLAPLVSEEIANLILNRGCT